MLIVRRLALFSALFFSVLTAASAAPALWVAEAPAAKVYLFGTIHVMKPQSTWHTATLDAALAESSDLWLEVPNADDAAAAAPFLASLGMDMAHALSTKIAKSDVARIDDAAKALGAPGESSFELFRPWLASIALSMAPLMRAGYDSKSGIDIQLKSSFDAAKKPVHGFETLEQQLHFFADLPSEQEVAMLHATLDQMPTELDTFEKLATAWSAGDLDRLSTLLEASYLSEPSLYDRMVVRRNADWALQLSAQLKHPGVIFVAVGAAHLAGAASVQIDLEKMGYHVRRIQ